MLRLLFSFFFFFNDTAPTEIYTLSLHDALPICGGGMVEQVVPKPETEDVVDEAVAPPWMTILHNCECHTFEQVVKQLQKAIACSEAEGWEIAWQGHNTGKAVVKIGPQAECVRVGNILASIGLVVTLVQS